MDKKSISRLLALILAVAVLFTVFEQFDGTLTTTQSGVSYTQFMADAKAGKIARVDVQGSRITVTPQSGPEYTLTSPGDIWMVEDLREAGIGQKRLKGVLDQQAAVRILESYLNAPSRALPLDEGI